MAGIHNLEKTFVMILVAHPMERAADVQQATGQAAQVEVAFGDAVFQQPLRAGKQLLDSAGDTAICSLLQLALEALAQVAVERGGQFPTCFKLITADDAT